MSKEIRITTQNLWGATAPTTPDCYLSPDDPIHAYKMAAIAGISPDSAMARHKLQVDERAWHERQNSPEMQYAIDHNIKPGSVAWNALFGK